MENLRLADPTFKSDIYQISQTLIKCLTHLSNVSKIGQIFHETHLCPDFQACLTYKSTVRKFNVK